MNYGGWTVASSNGGFFDTATIPSGMFNPNPSGTFFVKEFHGSEWNHLDWLLFFGGTGAPMGFDNLVLSVPASVPEPPTWFLLLAGITLLTIRQRKKRDAEMPNLVDMRTGAG